MNFTDLANRVLEGIVRPEKRCLGVLQTSNEHLLDLLAAAYRIRRHYFGNTVRLQMLLNAKSGACQEDCHYCSQSSISTAPIDRYAMISPTEMVEGARRAAHAKAQRYCIVISGRSPLGPGNSGNFHCGATDQGRNADSSLLFLRDS